MCVQCGRCEKHCPQQIPIRDMLKQAKKTLEFPGYGLGIKVLKTFMKY